MIAMFLGHPYRSASAKQLLGPPVVLQIHTLLYNGHNGCFVEGVLISLLHL